MGYDVEGGRVGGELLIAMCVSRGSDLPFVIQQFASR